MKRTVLISLFIIFAIFAVYGQSSSIDLVLVLDTSQGMSSSYDNVSNYLTGGFLTEFLRIGDTFHLISFSENQRLDIARRISGIGDVETIIGRMLLQYPVESGNSVENALTFTENYIKTLPARPKKIVLISASGSGSGLVSASRQRIGSGNTIDFVQVTPGQPLTNLPRSGRTSTAAVTQSAQAAPAQATPPAQTQTTPVQSAPAQTTQTQTPAQTAPAVTAPAQTQTTPVQSAPAQTTQTQTPAQTTPAVTAPEQTQTAPVQTQTQIADTPPVQTSPETAAVTAPAQTQTQTTTPAQTASPSQTQPASSSPAVTSSPRTAAGSQRQSSSEPWYKSLPFIIALIILALLILGLIIFFLSKKIGKGGSAAASAPVKTAAAAAPLEKAVDHSKDLASYKSTQNRRTTPYDALDKTKPVEISPTGPLLLNLFVEDQNTNIGKRNIHNLKSGYKLSVGGGKSDDFYIFLVPMPANIGEIRRSGSQLTFTPHKPKYFPEIGSGEVKDCINKTINIVSDKNYEMRFRFEMYEDPLVELNRILNSLNVPG